MKTILLAFALVGTGCLAKQDGSVGQAEAQSAGDALGNGIEDSAGSFGPVNAGATLDASCVTVTGDTTDTDGDSIPANGMLSFSCTAMALGYTGMLTGTESVVDDQPTAIAWAFTANADLHASLTGPLGGSIVRDWSGEIVATQAAPIGPFALHRTLDATTVFTGAGGHATTVTEANDWTVTYTPQASWTPGGVVVTGALAATGSWDVTVGSHAATATLATPTPLTLDPACATRVTAGTVTGTYEAGTRTRTISVTWSACGQRTVDYSEH